MRLLPRRRPAATLALSPAGPHRATETVTAQVTLDEPLDGITRACVELGYVNTYRYRWAGRRDAAVGFDDTSLATMGQVGTSCGSDKDTEAWVAVLDEPLPAPGGVLAAGTHAVGLRLPSWSPGSSRSAVSWRVRLRIERQGRDSEDEAELTVLVAAPDPPPADLPLIQGESALSDLVAFDVTTERPCYRAGEPVRGVVTLTPRRAVTRTAELGVWFMRVQRSHPLERTPAEATEAFTRPMVTVAKDLQLVEGVTTAVPFSVTLPADADPTTEAVHCSLDWFVQVRLSFAGATGGIERARRGIVVHTA